MPKAKQPDLGPHQWFGSARYLGGHSGFSEGWTGVLFFTEKAIGLGKSEDSGPIETVISMEAVATIQITGKQVAKSKVGPVLLFGVLGLGAKGVADETTVVVRTNDRETAYYAIADMPPERVRALLTPLLNWLKVPFYDEVRAQAPRDFADELRKLAALRDEGLLTEAEFDAQKSRLLNPTSSPPTPPPPPPP